MLTRFSIKNYRGILGQFGIRAAPTRGPVPSVTAIFGPDHVAPDMVRALRFAQDPTDSYHFRYGSRSPEVEYDLLIDDSVVYYTVRATRSTVHGGRSRITYEHMAIDGDAVFTRDQDDVRSDRFWVGAIDSTTSVLSTLSTNDDPTIRASARWFYGVRPISPSFSGTLMFAVHPTIHPTDLRWLVESFNPARQLVLVTHCTGLLNVLPPNAVWFASESGTSCLADFRCATDPDLDLEAAYLDGRFGHVPTPSSFDDAIWHHYFGND